MAVQSRATAMPRVTVARRPFASTSAAAGEPAALEKGMSRMMHGDWAGAVTAFDELLLIDPTHVRGTLNRAIALHHLQRREESVKVWREMLPRVSDDLRLVGVCLFHLAVTTSEAGHYEEAIKQFDEALVRTEPAAERRDVLDVRGRIYCGKGYALASLKRFDEANACWLKGFECSPTDFDNVVSLAHSYHSAANLDEAYRWYLVAAKLLPSPHVLSNFATCLAELKRGSELTQLYAEALKLNEEPGAVASISYRFGLAFHAIGAHGEAMVAYARALEAPAVPGGADADQPVDNSNVKVGTPHWFAVVHAARAATREVAGESKEAILQELEDGMTHRITLDALLNKSLICVALGRKEDAQEALAAAFALDPTGAKAHLEKFYAAATESAAKQKGEKDSKKD
jgi:tetratricopeptide (TPR) repeat protein